MKKFFLKSEILIVCYGFFPKSYSERVILKNKIKSIVNKAGENCVIRLFGHSFDDVPDDFFDIEANIIVSSVDEVSLNLKRDSLYLSSLDICSLDIALSHSPIDEAGEDSLVLVCSWRSSLGPLDLSLPSEYLYLEYDDDIDVGYKHDWFFSSPNIVKEFINFRYFFFKASEEGSHFSMLFHKTGWPMAIQRNFFLKSCRGFIRLVVKLFILRLDLKPILGFSKVIQSKYIGLRLRLNDFILTTNQTGETLLPLGCSVGVTYGLRRVTSQAIFKGFILEKNLRSRVRFLHLNDFEDEGGF